MHFSPPKYFESPPNLKVNIKSIKFIFWKKKSVLKKIFTVILRLESSFRIGKLLQTLLSRASTMIFFPNSVENRCYFYFQVIWHPLLRNETKLNFFLDRFYIPAKNLAIWLVFYLVMSQSSNLMIWM